MFKSLRRRLLKFVLACVSAMVLILAYTFCFRAAPSIDMGRVLPGMSFVENGIFEELGGRTTFCYAIYSGPETRSAVVHEMESRLMGLEGFHREEMPAAYKYLQYSDLYGRAFLVFDGKYPDDFAFWIYPRPPDQFSNQPGTTVIVAEPLSRVGFVNTRLLYQETERTIFRQGAHYHRD